MARPRTRARRSTWGSIRPRRRADGSTVWEFEPPVRLGLKGEGGTFKTPEEAEARRDELRESLRQQTFVPREAGKELVREWGERWFATLRGEEQSRKNRRSHLNAWIYPAWGDRGIGEITTLDIETLLADAERQGRAPWTLTKLWQTMDMMFSSAVANSIIARNPCNGVRKSARPTQERLRDPRMLNDEQKSALHAAAPAGRNRLVLAIGFRMGLRSQEIAALERNDVHVRDGTTRLLVDEARGEKRAKKRTKTKAGKRKVLVWPDLAADLHAYISQARPGVNDLLFPDDEGYMMTRWFVNDSIWQPAAEAAGIPHGLESGYIFRDLRSTCVMDLLNAGNPPNRVMEYIGHSSSRLVMEVYRVMEQEGLDDMVAPSSPARHLRVAGDVP